MKNSFKKILLIDKKCTDYLKEGIIVNENSFTAIFTIKIYELFSKKNKKSYAKVLSRSQEEKFGCDAIIIIKEKKDYYIGFWEAKLPKLNKQWDYKEKKSNIYHFNKQISNQGFNKICSWEMFYNNGSLNSVFINMLESSLCVWKKDIESEIKKNNIKKWDNKSLLVVSKIGKNIEEILNSMLINCIPYKNSNGNINLNDLKISIPIYNQENEEEINIFMKNNGLISYLYLDLQNEQN